MFHGFGNKKTYIVKGKIKSILLYPAIQLVMWYMTSYLMLQKIVSMLFPILENYFTNFSWLFSYLWFLSWGSTRSAASYLWSNHQNSDIYFEHRVWWEQWEASLQQQFISLSLFSSTIYVQLLPSQDHEFYMNIVYICLL